MIEESEAQIKFKLVAAKKLEAMPSPQNDDMQAQAHLSYFGDDGNAGMR